MARGAWLFALVPLGLFACALLALGPAEGSSYPGSGDWTLGPLANETVTGETITLSGNLSVGGTITFVNSTLTVDRNVTISGRLVLVNSSLTFTVDGPGTNYLRALPGANVSLRDFDGNAASAGDGSLLRGAPLPFNSTFGANASLTVVNSRVQGAGWARPAPFVLGPGFLMAGARLDVRGSAFVGGFELFVIAGADNASILNSTFDGFVSIVNLTGGSGHRFAGLSIVNHTFGLRIANATGVLVDGLGAGPTVAQPYAPPNAPPTGTAVAFTGVGASRIQNLSVQGVPQAPSPRNVAGFQLSNSTGIDVDGFTGRWGELVAQIGFSSRVTLSNFDAENFSQPLDIVLSNNLTLVAGRFVGERTGITLSNSADFDMRSVAAGQVQVPVLTASGPSGTYSIQNLVVADCPVAVLIQGSPASLVLFDVRVTNSSDPVQIDGTSLQTMMDTLSFAWISGEAVRASFADAANFSLRNLTATNVSGLTLNFTAANASRLSLADWRVAGANSTVALLDAANLTDLTVSRLWAAEHAGSVVQIEADAIVRVALEGISSQNSSGSVILVNGGAIAGLEARNITLLSGDVPPIAQALGAIVVDATGQGGAHPQGALSGLVVDGLLLNVSNRGGLYVAAPGTGALSAANISMTSAQFEGIRVVGGGAPWSIAMSNVSYLQSGGAAVRLEYVGGAALQGLDLDSPVGVQLEGTQGVTLSDVRFNGSYTAVRASNCAGLSVARVVAVGGFALDVSACNDVDLSDVDARASVFALRAVSSSRWRVDGLAVAGSTGAVMLRGSSDFLFTNLSAEFAAQGFVATVGSGNITLVSPRFTAPPSGASRTLFEASYATAVRVENLTFRGVCRQAALVQYASRVDLLGFDAQTCGVGVEIASTDYVNLTGLHLAGAFNGSALVISASSFVVVAGGNLSRAAESALLLVGSDRAVFSNLDGRGAGAEGALLAFVSNITLDQVNLDGAGGAGLRILYGAPNVTARRVSARGTPYGVELLASPGASLDGVDASDSGGAGVYVDPLSPGVLLKNVTAARNFGNGLLIAVNGTRLVDGNFSLNGQSALGVAPLIRLDWTVEGLATLVDETVDLTGDLTVSAGGALRVLRSNITVEQTARLRALQGYARLSVGVGGLLRLDVSLLAARDTLRPYSIEIAQGGWLEVENSTLRGGGKGDATSSLNATGAALTFTWSIVREWYAPLRAQGGSFNGSHCTFTQNTRGPEFVGGAAAILDLSASQQAGDGLAASQGARIAIDSAFVAFNGGRGVVLEGDVNASISGLTALGNAQGGVSVTGGSLSGATVNVNKSGGPGLQMAGGTLLNLTGFGAADNAGAGAFVVGTDQVFLGLGLVSNNTGQGIYLEGVQGAWVTGGRVEKSAVFGLQALNSVRVSVDGTSFSDDAGGAVRVEGSGSFFLLNSALSTGAEHAVVLLGSTQAAISDCLLSGLTAGLLASDRVAALVTNSTMDEPTVSLAALVTIAWNVRVLVQDPQGFPAVSALVTVADGSPSVPASASTGAGGATPLFVAVERQIHGDGSQEVFGPARIEAVHPALGRARTSLNITHYTAVGLRLDNGTPQSAATFDRPGGPSGWFQEPVSLSLRGADDRPDGVGLFYRVGQGPWLNVSVASESVVVVLAFSAEGSTRVEFYAVDAAGNQEALRSETVRIDFEPPTASFGQAQNFTAFSTPVSLTWSGSDPTGSGIESFVVTYTFRGRTESPWPSGTQEGGFAFALAEEGDYEFTVQAFDRAQRASNTDTLTVHLRLTGTIHLTSRNEAGALLSNVTYTLVELNRSLTGSGALDFRGVPPGNFTLRVSAEGFESLDRAVFVRPGQTTEVDVTLDPAVGGRGGLDLTAAYLALAALALFSASYYVSNQRKWERRAKEREAEADALSTKKGKKPKGPAPP